MKQACDICGKNVVRLDRHLRSIHNLAADTLTPTSVKSFLELLRYIPVSSTELKYFEENSSHIKKFVSDNIALPDKVFNKICVAFERYQKTCGPKLIINYERRRKLKRKQSPPPLQQQ